MGYVFAKSIIDEFIKDSGYKPSTIKYTYVHDLYGEYKAYCSGKYAYVTKCIFMDLFELKKVKIARKRRGYVFYLTKDKNHNW